MERRDSDALVLFRGDRGPVLSQDLSGAVSPGAPQPPQRAGDRRGAAGLEARAARRACARASRSSCTTSVQPWRRASSACCVTSTAITTIAPRSQRCSRHSVRRSAPELPRHPAEHVCGRDPASGRDRREGARVVVEKPFGRDLKSARQLNVTLHKHFPEPHLSDRSLPRQGGGAESAVLPLRQLVSRAGVEPQLRRQRADHDGRIARRRRPRQVLQETGALRDVIRIICCRSWRCSPWSRR